MRGKAAHDAYAREAAEQEVRREAQRRLHRFRIDVNEPARITFLDGALDEDGLLAVPSLYEHSVQLAGRWATFVCVGGGAEPCPICDSGRPPALVAAFTVIDHRPYTIRRGPRAGTVVVDQRKLFVAKKGTLARLQVKATALKGIDGVTMAVMTRVMLEASESPRMLDIFRLPDVEVACADLLPPCGDDFAAGGLLQSGKLVGGGG